MRKWLVALMIAAGAALFAVPAFAISQPQKLNFVDVTENNHVIGSFMFDRAPVGGDGFASTDGLYKWAGAKRGARAGRLETFCTVSYATNSGFTAFCTGQAILPSGTVLAQGFARFSYSGPAQFTLPVVGGTGSYANVRGFVRVRDLGSGDSGISNLELDLTP